MRYRENKFFPLFLLAVLLLGGFAWGSFARERKESSQTLLVDFDQDGLSNEEERLYGTDPNNDDTDGDGFSDGVEVRSGYDPLVPASEGDKILETDTVASRYEKSVSGTNLTRQFSAKVAGVTAEALAGNGEISVEQLNEELEDIVNTRISFADLPPIDPSEIRIKKQDYKKLNKKERAERIKQDAEEYISAVSYVINVHSPENIQDPDAAEKFAQEILRKVNGLAVDPTDVGYFKDLARNAEKALNDIREVEVPETLLEQHIKILQVVEYAVTIGEEFKPDKDDPLAMMGSYVELQQLGMLGLELSDELDERLQELGVKGGLGLSFGF